MAPFLTRREALGGAAAAAVLASCGGGDPPPGGARPGSGAALLSSVLALRLAVIAAYGACYEVLAGDELRQLRAIRAQELSSARFLSRVIEELGAEPPRGKTASEYARTFPRLRNAADALRFAQHLEEREVRAGLDAITHLPDVRLRSAVMGGLADDCLHLGAVRVLQGLPAAQGPFVTGAL